MKAEESKDENTRLAGRAMRRAARKVLGEAVRDGEEVPLWNGSEVVWRIPKAEVEQMDARDAHPSRP